MAAEIYANHDLATKWAPQVIVELDIRREVAVSRSHAGGTWQRGIEQYSWCTQGCRSGHMSRSWYLHNTHSARTNN